MKTRPTRDEMKMNCSKNSNTNKIVKASYVEEKTEKRPRKRVSLKEQ
jgi:hypothetical protein